MNLERQRQHEATKARRARMGSAPPVCRAIPIAAVREAPKPPRRKAERRMTMEAKEAIEREHQVRVQCVTASYEAERDRHRAMFKHVMEDCRKREAEDMGDLNAYRIDLLRGVS